MVHEVIVNAATNETVSEDVYKNWVTSTTRLRLVDYQWPTPKNIYTGVLSKNKYARQTIVVTECCIRPLLGPLWQRRPIHYRLIWRLVSTRHPETNKQIHTRGVQKVHRLTQLTTRYAHHILSLFDIFSCKWYALGPGFLQSSHSVVEELLFLVSEPAILLCR